MASENRKFNRSRNLDKGWSKREKHTIYIIGIIVVIFSGILSRFVFQNFDGGEDSFQKYIGGILPDSIVCMATNKIVPKPTKSIARDGNIFWGCCENCRTKLLNNDNNIQYAIDPSSGNQLMKSKAIIYADPENVGKVLYFESNDNYKAYSKYMNRE